MCYKPRTQSNWPVTARLTALFSERSVPAFCHELRELVTRCREGPRLFPANASWGQSPLSRSKQLQSTLRPMSWKERADAPSRRKGRGARAGALGQGRPLITRVVIDQSRQELKLEEHTKFSCYFSSHKFHETGFLQQKQAMLSHFSMS